jgi:hypothetical protein
MTSETIDLKDVEGQQLAERSKVAKRPRLLYIDNLRIVLITAVIFYHAAIVYGASGVFPYREGRADELTLMLFTLVMVVFGSFGLGLFYMIAGYFTPGSCDRKGTSPFFRDRLIRLGIPLLIYILIIDPLIAYAVRVVTGGMRLSFSSYLSLHFSNYGTLGVGPMWFVEVLLIFTLLYVLWRYISRYLPTDQFLQEGDMPGNLAIVGFAVALGVATFIWRIWLPEGSYFRLLGLPMASMPQYIALFTVGIVAYRRNWLATLSDSRAKLWFWVAVFLVFVVFPLMLVFTGALEGNTQPLLGGLHWQSLVRSLWEQLLAVAMVIVLTIWFRRRFNHQGRIARSMSASAYAVYFIHAPVLVAMGLLFRDVSLHPLIKFAVVGPLSVTLCFLIGHYFRKLPLVRGIF